VKDDVAHLLKCVAGKNSIGW